MKEIDEIGNIQKHFDELYHEIVNSEFKSIDEIGKINGIYVFYEEDEAQYVGRTNKERMKERLKGHTQPGSRHSSASFAFRITKKEKNQPDLKEIDPYDPHFVKAKDRVRNMKIRIIEMNDPIIQTMFEP